MVSSVGNLLKTVTGSHGSGLSREFFDLVKAIGESKSKQEEDRIISHEAAVLRTLFLDPAVTPMKLKEYLVRSLYVEMLGHDGSFSLIHAVKLAADRNPICKRVGYLISSLSLSPEDPKILLLVNTLQRDLQSSAVLDVSAALSCTARLMNHEIIPAIDNRLLKIVSESSSASLRRKAILVLAKIATTDSTSLSKFTPLIKKSIADSDPSTVFAAAEFIMTVLKSRNLKINNCNNNDSGFAQIEEFYRDIKESALPALVSVLKQLLDHKVPLEFEYHRVASPWLMIRILNLFSLLCRDDHSASEKVYHILHEVIRKSEANAVNISCAVVLEAVRTAATIYPDPNLLQLAAASIGRFLKSTNRNLRFVGISVLHCLVKVDPSLIAPLQLPVVDSLEDSDETLRRSTLFLLSRMATSKNSEIICEKLLSYAETCLDTPTRLEMLNRLMDVAERLAPSFEYYFDLCLNVAFKFDNQTPPSSIESLFTILLEGTDTGDQRDLECRTHALRKSLEGASKFSSGSEAAVKICVWVLGEFGGLLSSFPESDYSYPVDILDLLRDALLPNVSYRNPECMMWALLAYFKVAAGGRARTPNQVPDWWSDVMNTISEVMKFNTSNPSLVQLCHEFLTISQNVSFLSKFYPSSERRKSKISSRSLFQTVNANQLKAFSSELSQLGLLNSNSISSSSSILYRSAPTKPKQLSNPLRTEAYSPAKSVPKSLTLKEETDNKTASVKTMTVKTRRTDVPSQPPISPKEDAFVGASMNRKGGGRWGPQGYTVQSERQPVESIRNSSLGSVSSNKKTAPAQQPQKSKNYNDKQTDRYARSRKTAETTDEITLDPKKIEVANALFSGYITNKTAEPNDITDNKKLKNKKIDRVEDNETETEIQNQSCSTFESEMNIDSNVVISNSRDDNLIDWKEENKILVDSEFDFKIIKKKNDINVNSRDLLKTETSVSDSLNFKNNNLIDNKINNNYFDDIQQECQNSNNNNNSNLFTDSFTPTAAILSAEKSNRFFLSPLVIDIQKTEALWSFLPIEISSSFFCSSSSLTVHKAFEILENLFFEIQVDSSEGMGAACSYSADSHLIESPAPDSENCKLVFLLFLKIERLEVSTIIKSNGTRRYCEDVCAHIKKTLSEFWS